MTLPVSSYEELLVQVRELTNETILLQRQLSSDLFENPAPSDVNHNLSVIEKNCKNGKLLTDNVLRQYDRHRRTDCERNHLSKYSLGCRPRFCRSLESSTESIRSGELTSQLLVWNNPSYRQVISQGDADTYRHNYLQGRAEQIIYPENGKEECRHVLNGSQHVGVESSSRGSGDGDGVLRGSYRYPQGLLQKQIVTPLEVVGTPSTTTTTTPSPSRRELVESSSSSVSSAATAAYNPVVAAVAAATATTSTTPTTTSSSSRCLHPKVRHIIPLEQLPTDNARSRLYLGIASRITTNEINNKEDVMEPEIKEEDERRSTVSSPEVYREVQRHCNGDESSEEEKLDYSLQSQRLPASYRGTWPIRRDLWANQQMGFSVQQNLPSGTHNDIARGSSFSSPPGSGHSRSSAEIQGHRRLVTKVGVVYNLLDMLGSTEGQEDMSATLLSMSNSVDNCLVMRQSGCLPLLVQLIHAPGQDAETRERASQALHNVVHAKSDERTGRREARVLRFLQQLRDYCQAMRTSLKTGQHEDLERHPGPTIAALMKLSFDEGHRHAMCQLGGLHAVAELIEMDHLAHGSECDDHNFITLRRYAGMALTNLTFGDGNNKALLCSFREFMKALVSQLRNPSDDLRQVTASLLRNLSWRADSNSKKTLREVGAVTGLMKAAMEVRKESTLKSILSALWNLSAHCSTNKVDICAVDGALAFIVDTLSYKAPSKTLTIIENAGGILRNVSSHIAVRDDYRAIVRDKGCLQVLLQQLRSPSLTVVSNACGALWNLSARCPQDQRLLWDLGAVPMLRSLVHSKHKMISMGSSAALKNLLSARPGYNSLVHLDSTARGLGLPTLPTLVARRQKALEQEIDPNLAETCDNIEPSTSPTNKDDKFTIKVDHSFLGINPRSLRPYQVQTNQPSTSKCNGVTRSESRESMRSVTSTHSDTMFERVSRNVLNGMSPSELQLKQQSSSLHSGVGFDNGVLSDDHTKLVSSEKKYTIRYKNAIPEHLKTSSDELKCTNSTISWSSVPDQESNCSQILLHSSVEDNLSSINESVSSTPKAAHSQSSISEDVETTLCTKSDYKTASQMFTASSSTSLSFVTNDNGGKETSSYGYRSKSSSHQIDSLNDITNTIKPPINSEEDPFGDYAETDLDQPTDYSLRYAECTTDEDEKQDSTYFTGSEQGFVHEDSIKTYCTEGTPYETSLNSSRATSATDLQDDGSKNKSLYKKSIQQSMEQQARMSPYFLLDAKNEQLKSGYPDNESSVKNLSSVKPSIDMVVRDQQRSNRHTKCDTEHNKSDIKSLPENIDQVSDGDEDDEDLLTACINIGMQNNRHRHSFIGNNFEKTSTNQSLFRYQTNTALDQMEFTPEEKLNTLKQPSSLNTNECNFDYSEIDPTSKSLCVLPQACSENISNKTHRLDSKIAVKESAKSLDINAPREENIASSEKEIKNDSLEKSPSLPTRAICEDKTEEFSNKQAYAKATDSESSESFDSVEQSEHALLELCIKSGMPKKNDDDAQIDTSSKHHEQNTNQTENTKKDKISDVKYKNNVKKEIEKSQNSADNSEKQVEVYRRQRDPDAMIASLDRLTATLVQQTEAIRERDSNAMKQSIQSDTWNEDSPNEVSFPSISMSAPLIASFKSDIQEEEDDQVTLSLEHETKNSDELSMTTSKIIEQEAIKLAEAVDAEAKNQTELEMMSITSMDLEAIRPPSSMGSLGSLTASCGGHMETTDMNKERFTSLPSQNRVQGDPKNCRKKSLPVGVVAKRALNYTSNHTASLENLLNECTNSHLESVKPPSIMDEVFDMGDMENSMLSVASITSEVADSKDQDSHSLTGSDTVFDLLKPVANVLSMTCMRYAEMQNSLSECLENINPPSLFNEVSEMDESTMEAPVDTLCSDTLCIDAELNTEEVPCSTIREDDCLDDEEEEDDDDDNDTNDVVTSISSEYCASSVESTPKKRLNLTPKQKRNLAKERYKTYTIAVEIIKKEQERKMYNQDNEIVQIPRGKCSSISKLTPKQKRQEDRARFQTQVLENPFPNLNVNSDDVTYEVESRTTSDNNTPAVPVRSAIPMLKKISGCKVMRKKESKERYRTRTLNESESIFAGIETKTNEQEVQDGKPDVIQTMLEQNATIVLNTLNESNTINDVVGEELLLDCETISLISNDSESERSLRVRFVNGLSKKLMSTCIEQADNAQNSTAHYEEQEESCRPEFNSESESEEDDESKQTEEQSQEVKRPRIIKPDMSRDLSLESNLTDKSDTESPKAIRGRRKALYSTPITRKSTPQSSPLKQAANPVSGIPIGRSNTSPIVRATRATTLRQNNNTPGLVTKEPLKFNKSPKPLTTTVDSEKKVRMQGPTQIKSTVPPKGLSAIPPKSTKKPSVNMSTCSNENKVESPIKPLERQGTFTKDEPEVENAPTVFVPPSPIRTKIAKPIKNVTSKVHPAVGKSKLSVRTYPAHQSKITKATNNTDKSPSNKGSTLLGASKRIPNGKLVGLAKSNQHIPVNDNGKTLRKIGLLGQRSNSNSSIVSNSSAEMSQGRKSTKEATSKIANLWKKVEENKMKQRFEKPDTRQWISPNETNESNPPAFRLFRSSTFEGGVSQETVDESKRLPTTNTQSNGIKYRNSCDLSGINGNDAPCKIPVKLSDNSSSKKDALSSKGTAQHVSLRRQQSADSSKNETDSSKRISRLGSFIQVDSALTENGHTQIFPVSAAGIPPFNYNSSHTVQTDSDEADGKFETSEYSNNHILTNSSRITTV